MSIDSPTYDCGSSSGDAPSVNTTNAYCIVPGSSPRMALCCSNLGTMGQQPTHVSDTCFAWCEVNLSNSDSNSAQGQLQDAANSFAYCLSHGTNASDPTGMTCNYQATSNFGFLSAQNLTVTPTVQMSPSQTSDASQVSGSGDGSGSGSGDGDGGNGATLGKGSVKGSLMLGAVLGFFALGMTL